MSESSSEPRTLTRADYDRLEHYGYAGPTTALTTTDTDVVNRWQQQSPGWRARHWAYLNDDEVLRLAAVNVARRTTATAA
ncbi:hypothetical protein [Nocardia jinanensis]|uniref:Uncharacterized protein n=1 Tax=Nocardia jinanensis TaxID=382504 RepID=A0A917RYS4_9NOCA|nr:hypothetical protein [Nocardia jinanensis]GGL45849.1 hypothetical protein GCM10011588_70750 [Nocardia jinanensis]